MKIAELKSLLTQLDTVNFKIQNGPYVPDHFHVTEVGVVTKHFIDCGGTVRNEKVANFQLWNADDFDHRLKPIKLLKIIELSESILGLENLEIEIEFQTETVGKYELGFNGKNFELIAKQTACLASAACGIISPTQQNPINQAASANHCKPGGGCC